MTAHHNKSKGGKWGQDRHQITVTLDYFATELGHQITLETVRAAIKAIEQADRLGITFEAATIEADPQNNKSGGK